jgi:predicted TIM-barrel fold metal-dependent hydrolase
MPDAPYPPVEVPRAERAAGPAPAETPKLPTTRAPVGSCDAHVHMLAGPSERPLWDGRVEDPAPGLGFEDWLGRLRQQMDLLGFTRVVVVQSILYGTDNTVALDAVRRIGDGARAVALVTQDATDEHLDALRDAGAVAVRLNHVHGGVLSWEGARALAPRLAERGMHLQMLLHADAHMEEVAADLGDLPVPLVIDHAGWPRDMGAPGVELMSRLLAEGRIWAKLSGIYRLTEPPWTETDPLVRQIVEANPERCLWGSDWPHIMLADAAMPDAGLLLDAFMRAVEDPEDRQRVLVDNPAALFGF